EGSEAHVLDVTSDDSVARCLEEVGPSMQSSTTQVYLAEGQWKAIHLIVELSHVLRQTVKTHFSFNGELSNEVVSTEVHEGVQGGGGPAIGIRGVVGRSGACM